jgi:hypothetical protein
MIQENWKTLCDMLIQNKSEDEFETFIDRIVSEARKEEKARAEKAEGELKAIKARIEDFINNKHIKDLSERYICLMRNCPEKKVHCYDCEHNEAYHVKKLIKQIGGEK